ncbi:MAG: hypothetical protein K2I31_01930, partial [Duncaniella sp.]|nr:hypothetical protein [Duncaniella sp.]
PEENDDKSSEEKKSEAAKANDPHYPEYYLKQIPSTDVEKTTAEDVIREGLYNSGLILKDKLEDFDAADAEWQRLMNRYPDNIYRLDIYYNEYLMNLRANRPAEAERYRQLILSDFPESNFAKAMADPNYIENLQSMFTRQEQLYEDAYANYLADNNAKVHEAYSRMKTEYPLSPLMPKFMFLEALAYVTDNKPEEFGATLTELLERYPDTDVTPMASAYLRGLAQGRKLRSGGSNMRSMLWDIRLSNDSTSTESGEIDFTLEPEEPHYLVLLFSTENISPNQLLFDVARHNFTTYMVRDFDLEVMNFGQLGLLLIKGFRNEGELNHYRSLLAQDNGVMLPEGVRPVQISKSNFEKLLQSGGSFDDYFRFIGEESIRETHESVLSPEEYPSAGEMYGGGNDNSADGESTGDEETIARPATAPEKTPKDKTEASDDFDIPVPVLETKPATESVNTDSVTTNVTAPHPSAVPAIKGDSLKNDADTLKKATPRPVVKPTQPPVPKPKAKKQPQKPAVPKPQPTKPKLPDYPLGSEGDEDD